MVRKKVIDGQRFTVYTICGPRREDSYVKEFLQGLERSHRDKVCRLIRHAADRFPLRKTEKCRHIERNLWELKEDFARIMLFCAGEGIMVLTHGFKKHSGPPLPVEIDRAKRLRDQYLLEYDNI